MLSLNRWLRWLSLHCDGYASRYRHSIELLVEFGTITQHETCMGGKPDIRPRNGRLFNFHATAPLTSKSVSPHQLPRSPCFAEGCPLCSVCQLIVAAPAHVIRVETVFILPALAKPKQPHEETIVEHARATGSLSVYLNILQLRERVSIRK